MNFRKEDALQEFCVLTKNTLTLIVSIIVKMNVCVGNKWCWCRWGWGSVMQKQKFPREKVMVRLDVCFSKGLTTLLILDEETFDHSCYMKNVLPVALKCGNEVFGDKWDFQQDDADPHWHHLTQEWCWDNFPSLIDKDCWPPNSPYLNSLDHSNYDESINIIDWNKVRSQTDDTDLTIKLVGEESSEISCCWKLH